MATYTTKTVTLRDGTVLPDEQARSYGKTAPDTISSQTLAPAPPYTLPTPFNRPTTDNLAMSTNAFTSQIATDATPMETTATRNKDSLAEMLKSLSGDIASQSSETDQIRNETQIYEKKQRATAVSNQLDQMDKAYRDEIARIKTNPQGKFGDAMQQEINAATDRYENNRANVALTYKVLSGDYNDAQQIVQDKISSLQTQNAQKIQLYQLAANAVQNDLTESEKLTVQANLTRKQKEAELVQTAYSSVLANAVQNGAPASVLSAIDTASRAPGATAASVMAAAGQYGVDALRQAQINAANRANQPGSEKRDTQVVNGKLIDMQTGEVIQDLSSSAGNQYVAANAPGTTSIDKNKTTLTQLFNDSKITAGNKTSVGNGLSLLSAAEDLANANPGGKFAGLNPIKGMFDWATPNAWKSQKTIQNESLISALDLQTQFWASGAALSPEQTALVQKMIPRKGDSDASVRAKTNQLVNYMLSQSASRLITDGVSFVPKTVDLYETNDLLNGASQEQIDQLKAEGLL